MNDAYISDKVTRPQIHMRRVIGTYLDAMTIYTRLRTEITPR